MTDDCSKEGDAENEQQESDQAKAPDHIFYELPIKKLLVLRSEGFACLAMMGRAKELMLIHFEEILQYKEERVSYLFPPFNCVTWPCFAITLKSDPPQYKQFPFMLLQA